MLLFKFGRLVNRGSLYGPWLPIYGFGCSGIMLFFGKIKFLKRLEKNPVLVFGIIMIICSALEYGSSWIIENGFNLKYWDYTGYFLNINGRTCFENALFFGIGGIVAMYLVAPKFYSFVGKMKAIPKIILIASLMTAIVIDLSYSLKYPHVGDFINEQSSLDKREENCNIINSNQNIQI